MGFSLCPIPPGCQLSEGRNSSLFVAAMAPGAAIGQYSVFMEWMTVVSMRDVLPITCAPGKHPAAGEGFVTQRHPPVSQGEGRWPGGQIGLFPYLLILMLSCGQGHLHRVLPHKAGQSQPFVVMDPLEPKAGGNEGL